MRKSKMLEEKGITLITLSVMIVVIFILSGVSINALLGTNGIIEKAKREKDKSSASISRDDRELNESAAIYENSMITDPTSPLPEGWDGNEVIAFNGGSETIVPIPRGFYYVGGTVKSGLVISDNRQDEGKGTSFKISSLLQGNQFVWIPVSNASDLTRTNFDSEGNAITGLSTSYTEPYANGYSTESSEYNTMRAQVLKYGGFYISRYEAGDATNGTTLRTETTTDHIVVSKKGVAPYNFIAWGGSMSNATTGAISLAKKMYSSSTSVTSTLCYGSQWDAMCRYIANSQKTTAIKSQPELTGSVSTDVSKNIYDLAGNCAEWTMEALTTYTERVTRGGKYNISNNKINTRSSNLGSTAVSKDITFRVTLYIK